MQRIQIDLHNPSLEIVTQAALVMKLGGLIVCPTETVYILAVDATNENAIEKVYEIKGRDFSKPLHVVVEDVKMATDYVNFNNVAHRLAEAFLPGPLTLVLEKKDGMPPLLTAGLPTLGIRITPLLLNRILARELGKPYTATSANKSGGGNPYTIEDVLAQLTQKDVRLVDLILDVGELPHLLPSTIIDCLTLPPKILREGPVTREEIEEALGIKVQ